MTISEYLHTLPRDRGAAFSSDAASNLCRMFQCETVPLIQRVCGVYLLFLGKTVVYVGQSKNTLMRVANHIDERVKLFDSYIIISTQPEDRLTRERQLIKTFRPYYNTVSIWDQGYLTAEDIAKKFDIGEGRVRQIIKENRIPWAWSSGNWCAVRPELIEPFVSR